MTDQPFKCLANLSFRWTHGDISLIRSIAKDGLAHYPGNSLLKGLVDNDSIFTAIVINIGDLTETLEVFEQAQNTVKCYKILDMMVNILGNQ